MATAPSPNDLTRQQLDELDALLQRMLSVPLAPPDTPMPGAFARGAADGVAPPLPPSWRVDPPAPASGASLPHLHLPDAPSSVALKFEPPAPPPAVPPAPPAPPAAKAAAKAAPVPPPPAPKAVTPAPKPVTVVAPPAPAVTPVPSAPPVALPLLPLVALNSLFDAACGMFGPPGRVLRSGFFKHIYGLVGLGLLAYTAAHVAQEMMWVTLPVTLPWPR